MREGIQRYWVNWRGHHVYLHDDPDLGDVVVDWGGSHVVRSKGLHAPAVALSWLDAHAAEFDEYTKREEQKRQRIRGGLCVTCGRALGLFDKIANRQFHKQCGGWGYS